MTPGRALFSELLTNPYLVLGTKESTISYGSSINGVTALEKGWSFCNSNTETVVTKKRVRLRLECLFA